MATTVVDRISMDRSFICNEGALRLLERNYDIALETYM